MGSTITNKSKRAAKIRVDKNMKSHTNDPFFVKKAKEAKALIEKYGVPKTASK
jgi:hypothetical protein